MKRTNKIWVAVALLLTTVGQTFADEGMWVLKELNKENLARMHSLFQRPTQFGEIRASGETPAMALV